MAQRRSLMSNHLITSYQFSFAIIDPFKMDIVVRRQSEFLSCSRQSSIANDESDCDEMISKKSENLFDVKKWEWGQLRVSKDACVRFYEIDKLIHNRFPIGFFLFLLLLQRRQNARIWNWRHFIERMCNACSAAIYRYFL